MGTVHVSPTNGQSIGTSPGSLPAPAHSFPSSSHAHSAPFPRCTDEYVVASVLCAVPRHSFNLARLGCIAMVWLRFFTRLFAMQLSPGSREVHPPGLTTLSNRVPPAV